MLSEPQSHRNILADIHVHPSLSYYPEFLSKLYKQLQTANGEQEEWERCHSFFVQLALLGSRDLFGS
jgi:hypothetical protein